MNFPVMVRRIDTPRDPQIAERVAAGSGRYPDLTGKGSQI
jgi:hypothetical protein